ncbi:twin-arginine translocase subunit TatC [Planctomicrobium sp. SH527]|uniref:twin-arginine translocase subunit TatC n=1 Tax=Planctomicrobium sp. SH527 TaxID=3448123 RepID=UPI003F5CA783
MKKPTKDLFDDSTMTFGEHLEILRKHLIRALIGLSFSVVICLYQGERLVAFVRAPIDSALREYSKPIPKDENLSSWERLKRDWGLNVAFSFYQGFEDFLAGRKSAEQLEIEREQSTPEQVTVTVPVDQLAKALHAVAPEQFPEIKTETPAAAVKPVSPAADSPTPENATPTPTATEAPKQIQLTLQAPQFAQFQATVEQQRRPVTLNVQEAFMTYLKVSIISGVLIASPWIFYQLWLFVAAGLYPHERKYVYVYGIMSLMLFLIGTMFCFFAVFPFVLHFLLNFNKTLEIQPQIRLSEWISFAVFLPVMFGISFQLPLVMLFLERISIFTVNVYREQRRMAILVIAILSSVLTPADPVSMLLMMFPLLFLYELGVRLCDWLPREGFQGRNEETPAIT